MEFEIGKEVICKTTGRVHKLLSMDPNGSVVLEARLLKARTTVPYADFINEYRPNPHSL